MTEPIYCKICGQPVNPSVDILFGAAGKPLFAAHQGRCAELVRGTVSFVGSTLRTLLQLKAPRAAALVEGVVAASRGRESTP